jgi:hypothetical protein
MILIEKILIGMAILIAVIIMFGNARHIMMSVIRVFSKIEKLFKKD